MGEGTRDALVTDDLFGIAGDGASGVGIMAPIRRRKSHRKHTKRVKHSRRRHHARKRHKSSKKSSRGIKYTKRGQPYRIMPNGRARFLPKRKK